VQWFDAQEVALTSVHAELSAEFETLTVVVAAG
jgi:hypothetical protein